MESGQLTLTGAPPSPWQGAEADEGENTFFVVVHQTSRSGAMKKLHVKLTRRNRSHEMMKMMMATTTMMMMMMVTMMMMMMMIVTMISMVMILI